MLLVTIKGLKILSTDTDTVSRESHQPVLKDVFVSPKTFCLPTEMLLSSN